MAIPQAHLVAFCGDIGIGAATGALMLSVLLGCAFFSRQFWGAFADRYGGLKTVLAGSVCQAVSIGAFLLTQNEAGLFAVAAAYGFGFSGIIPAYVVAIRDLFPSVEASWPRPAGTVLRDERDGVRELVCGSHLRSFRLLCAGLRLRRAVQPSQSGAGRLSRVPPVRALAPGRRNTCRSGMKPVRWTAAISTLQLLRLAG
jgi:hypothetical protein